MIINLVAPHQLKLNKLNSQRPLIPPVPLPLLISNLQLQLQVGQALSQHSSPLLTRLQRDLLLLSPHQHLHQLTTTITLISLAIPLLQTPTLMATVLITTEEVTNKKKTKPLLSSQIPLPSHPLKPLSSIPPSHLKHQLQIQTVTTT